VQANGILLVVSALTFVTALLGFTQAIAAQHKTRQQVLSATGMVNDHVNEVHVLVNSQLTAALARISQLQTHLEAANVAVPPILPDPPLPILHSADSVPDIAIR
jgi:hypothetical protein